MIIWSTLSIKYTSIMVFFVNFCQSDVLKTVIVWRLCVGLIRSSEVDIKMIYSILIMADSESEQEGEIPTNCNISIT